MAYPPSKRRASPPDPNADSVASEILAMKNAVAADNPSGNPGPNRYDPIEAPTSAKVANQIVADRGAKHSRA